jgi:cytochrome c oxidase cbb3-type subunit 3
MSNHDHQDDPLLLEHEADGIRELDNKLPRWWVWLFNLSIVFAAIYLGYYHVFAKGDLEKYGQMVTEYQAEKAVGDRLKGAAMAKFESAIAAVEPSKDTATLAEGRALFDRNCAPCHRYDAGGLVGPNLTDDFWIHGPNFADNVKTIWNGVTEKGMLAWKDQGMKPNEVLAVASYIYTLRGSKLEKPGKPPENQAPVQTGPNEYE